MAFANQLSLVITNWKDENKKLHCRGVSCRGMQMAFPSGSRIATALAGSAGRGLQLVAFSFQCLDGLDEVRHQPRVL